MVGILTRIKSWNVYFGGSCKCLRLIRIRSELDSAIKFFCSLDSQVSKNNSFNSARLFTNCK